MKFEVIVVKSFGRSNSMFGFANLSHVQDIVDTQCFNEETFSVEYLLLHATLISAFQNMFKALKDVCNKYMECLEVVF